MSVNSYGSGVLPSDDPGVIRKCLVGAGYTTPYMGQDLDGTLHCHVDDVVSSAAMKTAIEAEHPPPGSLSHDAATSPLVVAGDGVASSAVVVTDPRGAAAAGKTVKLRIPEGVFVPVDGDSVVLGAAGTGTFTFGPLSGCLGDVVLELYYESGEADPAPLTLRFGSA